MRRVPEVIDVWFDSGSMPFAQYHAPHDGTEQFEDHFPADFICEALDQTRGWFYSLLAVSTLLFDQSPYRNVVCLGLILDEDGRKMSQVAGQHVEPGEVIDRFGADALRWYFFTSKQPWDGYRFSLDAIGEAVRQFLLQLWNTYGFYVLYANANGIDRDAVAATDPAKRARPVGAVAPGGDDRDRPRPPGRLRRHERRPRDPGVRRRALQLVRAALAPALLGRRPGRRSPPCAPAAGDGQAAGAVLPVRRRRDLRQPRRDRAERPPVRLPDPGRGARDLELEETMAVARETVRLGLAARGQAKLKVRQPLRAAVVVATGSEREAIERMADVVREELNVKELRFVSEADELGADRAQAELPGARPALRQAHADGCRRGGRPRRLPCRLHAARRRQGGDRSRRHATTSWPPRTSRCR